ncbi:hypothetical protein D187_008809 [Cystobacter fuscus DSM 2262]|uniref:Uncharacterized protein n=1 Tax=Cystobacter fuscus (strain ATCC 25194 / DSM 2262 / NBRC 100088 / M29) TaxID=1242864 RepID=S9PHW1_CYSF2|nr:hypothetical protein [Cystobacter fuscus]EPX62621.1 hypothetical protein D187_008809 [Cystobacter fuscus DSM 2262]
MLLKHLYRISLEEPPLWCFFIGVGGQTSDMMEGLRIERLHAYIHGFKNAQREMSVEDEEASAFFDWLIETGEFPGQGWHCKYLSDEGGDELRAIGKFFGLLHKYLLEQRPAWFLDLNKAPQPSQIHRGSGEPVRPDIRLPGHVDVAASSR